MAFDRTDPADLLALKNEVNNDPEGLGYAAVVNVTADLLNLLNLPENNPQVNDTVNVPFDEFPIIDALDEIDNDEYKALQGVHKTNIDSIIRVGVARSDPNAGGGVSYFGSVKRLFRKAFNNLDPALIDPVPANNQSKTWLAVKDDRARQASRAEALFGRDTVLSREDWFAARDS